MEDNKTKKQLKIELEEMRKRVSGLGKSEAQHKRTKSTARQKKTEEALKRSEEKYKTVFENTGTAMCIVEEDTTISLVNKEFERLLGYSKEEIEGKMSWTDFVVKEDLEKMKEYHNKRRENKKSVPNRYEFRCFTREGKVKHILLTIDIIPGTKKTVASLMDITMQKEVEEGLKHKVLLEKTILKISTRFIGITDLDKAINKSLEDVGRLSGASRAYVFLFQQGGEVLNNTHEWCAEGVTPQINNLQNLSPHMTPWWMAKLRANEPIHIPDVSLLPEEASAEKEILEKQDIKSLLALPLRVRLKLAGFVGFDNVSETGMWSKENIMLCRLIGEIFSNAIECKQWEEKIQKNLQEKEVLLREIHHRVKNNMQIISSLINIQAGNVKSKGAFEALKSTQRRIYSMALVHERLYGSKDLARIDFNQYIEKIYNHLLSFYKDKMKKVKIKKDIKNVFLDINKAVPLGLIINELISNSLKHAFPDDKEGEIRIKFHKKDSWYELNISDNGVGLPEDMELEKVSSMGIQLITSLVNQIDGKIELDKKPHTSFNIKFQE